MDYDGFHFRWLAGWLTGLYLFFFALRVMRAGVEVIIWWPVMTLVVWLCGLGCCGLGARLLTYLGTYLLQLGCLYFFLNLSPVDGRIRAGLLCTYGCVANPGREHAQDAAAYLLLQLIPSSEICAWYGVLRIVL